MWRIFPLVDLVVSGAVHLEGRKGLFEGSSKVAGLVVDHTEQVVRPGERQRRRLTRGNRNSFGCEGERVVGMAALVGNGGQSVERFGFVIRQFRCTCERACVEDQFARPNGIVNSTRSSAIEQRSDF